jgi:hypothetical protein
LQLHAVADALMADALEGCADAASEVVWLLVHWLQLLLELPLTLHPALRPPAGCSAAGCSAAGCSAEGVAVALVSTAACFSAVCLQCLLIAFALYSCCSAAACCLRSRYPSLYTMGLCLLAAQPSWLRLSAGRQQAPPGKAPSSVPHPIRHLTTSPSCAARHRAYISPPLLELVLIPPASPPPPSPLLVSL